MSEKKYGNIDRHSAWDNDREHQVFQKKYHDASVLPNDSISMLIA